jgi:hypothetical protein
MGHGDISALDDPENVSVWKLGSARLSFPKGKDDLGTFGTCGRDECVRDEEGGRGSARHQTSCAV